MSKKKQEPVIFSQYQCRMMLWMHQNHVPWRDMVGQYGLNKFQVLRFLRLLKEGKLPRMRKRVAYKTEE